MTSETVSPEDAIRASERESARRMLSTHLRRGELSLLLGAGVSAELELPPWEKLVHDCERAAGVDAGIGENYLDRMDIVKASYKGDFLQLVRANLYGRDYLTDKTYPREILKSDMLIALGALAMSSVRGSVADVLTLNFDDVLDWYLQLHGFRTQIVTQLPTWFRGDVDVRIHHIHGFLPLMDEYTSSDWIILSGSEFLDRLGEALAPWSIFIGAQFQSKVILAIGTSLGDIDVKMILRRARNCARQAVRGYVVGVNMSQATLTNCDNLGLKAVQLSSFEEVPKFLLSICQSAAGEVEGLGAGRLVPVGSEVWA